jgi:hypothetical protein
MAALVWAKASIQALNDRLDIALGDTPCGERDEATIAINE